MPENTCTIREAINTALREEMARDARELAGDVVTHRRGDVDVMPA